MTEPEDVKRMLGIIVNGAIEFLDKEIGIIVNRQSQQSEVSGHFHLKPLTALMSISGCLKLNITFSFDCELIGQIYKVYCREFEIGEDEIEQYMNETASDMINIVIGNSTELLSEDGTIVEISVPYVIHEDGSYSVPKIKFLATTLYTDFGDMMITAILDSKEVNKVGDDRERSG